MKHNVLLADDDRSVRESLHKLLHTEGYQVVLAVNGEEAVEKSRLESPPFDLVLLDLNMPLKNGWAALDRLFEANPHLPVLVLTGLSDQDALAKAAGVSALVEKPIDVEALLQLMKQLLADPVHYRLQGISHGEVPFHHLRASDRASHDPNPKRPFTRYTRGGLNE